MVIEEDLQLQAVATVCVGELSIRKDHFTEKILVLTYGQNQRKMYIYNTILLTRIRRNQKQVQGK